jgi:hypothetical protein
MPLVGPQIAPTNLLEAVHAERGLSQKPSLEWDGTTGRFRTLRRRKAKEPSMGIQRRSLARVHLALSGHVGEADVPSSGI